MIRSAIIGYDSLGHSIERVVADQPDMELVSIFSHRDSPDTEVRVLLAVDVEKYKDEVDMLFVCLGSATDAPEQTPDLAKNPTTIGTYDDHREIPKHRAAMETTAHEGSNIAITPTGWDPGLFSLSQALGVAILSGTDQMTFWGPDLLQGHSDTVCHVSGAEKGIQYTKPDPEAIKAVKKGEGTDLKDNGCHLHHCFVIAEETGNVNEDAELKEQIRKTIMTVPDYSALYETIVDFIFEEEFDRNHQDMPHGDQIITRGRAGISGHVIEFGLDLDCNPDFTATIQAAYGRAAYRPKQAGGSSARTVLETVLYLLSVEPPGDLVTQKL